MMEQEKYHFWAGSECYINNPKSVYPNGVIAISDILTINADLGNQIPDKSWMIYMLELFIDREYVQENVRRPVPLELDLFCEFDNDNEFKAVFNGTNQYTFPKILPEIGNSYQREIILNASNRLIKYKLTDLKTGQSESFELTSNNMNGTVNEQQRQNLIKVIKEAKFEPYKHFTGIEWWNKIDTVPYPIRYQIQFSMLRYAHYDSSANLKEINYKPYTSMMPDTDRQGKQYPISFQNPRVMDGCICYDISSGTTNTGMTYSL
jgi:hypothetical protein